MSDGFDFGNLFTGVPQTTFPGTNIPIPSLPGFGTPPILPGGGAGVPTVPPVQTEKPWWQILGDLIAPGAGSAAAAARANSPEWQAFTKGPYGQALASVETFLVTVAGHALVNLIAILFLIGGIYLVFKEPIDRGVKTVASSAVKAAEVAAVV